MKRTATPREAYLEYLDGKRSFDSVLDITEQWAAEVRRNAHVPAPEVVAAEEAEARLRFERSRAKPLWEAYIQATHDKRSIESVLDLADHMRDFLLGSPEADEGGTGPQPSPIHEAYELCLDGEIPVDEVFGRADRFLGREPAAAESPPRASGSRHGGRT